MPPRRKNVRRKKGNHRGTPFIDQLPESLFTDILLRLSVKNLLKCKCISKGWQKRISDSQFTRLHYESHSNSKISLMIETSQRPPKSLYSYTIEHADGDLQIESMKFPLHYSIPHWKTVEVVNSCHGFVCLSKPPEDGDIYICNPILGEYITIPPSMYCGIGIANVLAIGFDNKTNDYKILKMTIMEDEDEDEDEDDDEDGRQYHAAEIYTIGDHEWRCLETFPVRSESDFLTLQNSFLHGAQHWLSRNGLGHVGSSIVSFNFEAERFRSLPLPLDIASVSTRDCKLEVLQGCLALCVLDRVHDSIDMWTMEEYGVQTSWIKKLVFQNLYGPNISYAVGITPTVFLNDVEIFICHERVFGRYNADEKSFMEARAIYSPVYDASTYHPSLVSLKDISKGRVVMRSLDANNGSGDNNQDSD